MSDSFANQELPRGVLLGAAALVGFTLLAAAGARVSEVGVTRTPPAAPVESRDLRFEDRNDGAVAVYAADGKLVEVIAPGTNGFVRGVLRGLARERKRQELGPQAAFRLTRWSDGRLSLDDPATGRHVDLEAFGPSNYGPFARMLTAHNTTP